MDDRKWTFKKILIFASLTTLALACSFVFYGVLIFLQTKNIQDPTKCFVTSMNHVHLCRESPHYVRYNDVPKHFFQSLILSEDGSFYTHKGFDWFEIKESFRRNIVEWKFARGGSTITQQLAKNLYLTTEKSLGRKFKEFFISKQIESKLTKTQILEKYINVVEFGEQVFGLQAASEKYFAKSPSLLNLLESVYLVSLLPSPKRLSQGFAEKQLSENNLWRMRIILRRLYRSKNISDTAYVYAKFLLEESPWPFENFNIELYEQNDEQSIDDELDMELNEAEFEDAEETENSSTPLPDGEEGDKINR